MTMALSLASASSQYLVNAGTPVADLPLTMACWFNKPTDAAGTLISLSNSVGENRILLVANTGPAIIQANTFLSVSVTTDTYGNNVWSHAAAVYASTSSRTAYLNGVAATENTDSDVTSTGFDRVHIGMRLVTSVPGLFLNGIIAEVGLWNIALAAADIASLAKGFSPLLIRPEGLVAYWPLIGNLSPEIDPVGGFAMTRTNTPTVSPHVNIILPDHGG
jgi:hypothetical protein